MRVERSLIELQLSRIVLRRRETLRLLRGGFLFAFFFHLKLYYGLGVVWMLAETDVKRFVKQFFPWKTGCFVVIILKSPEDKSNLDIV